MTRKLVILASATATSLVAIAALAQQQDHDASAEGLTVLGEPVTMEEIAVGRQLYAENCASCHGTNLEVEADRRRSPSTASR